VSVGLPNGDPMRSGLPNGNRSRVLRTLSANFPSVRAGGFFVCVCRVKPLNTNQLTMTELRRVLVGTPALDGRVDAWYADSLFDSIKLGLYQGINIIPSILHNESILPMSRNELIRSAVIHEVESLVFIDSDEQWVPQALLDLINSPYDVHGLPVPNKSDEVEGYNVRLLDAAGAERDGEGNICVDGVGTGFLKLSQRALQALWNTHPDVLFRGKTLKAVCEYGMVGNEFVSEDYNLCNKLRAAGFDIWVSTQYTVSHRGTKTWHGDFGGYLGRVG
jgi:hypothetical protein